MNIYRQELKFQIRSLLTWLLSIAAALLLFMGIYPGFAREADMLKEAMSVFPDYLMDSIGMDIDKIFEGSGFVSYIYGFIQLFLAIMAALYGFEVMSREKIARMNDFLYVRPTGRLAIFSQKLMVSVTVFLVIHVGLYAIFHFMGSQWAIDAPNMEAIDQIILGGFLLQLLIFAMATSLGIVTRRIKNPVGAATGLSFTLFLILLVGRLMDDDTVKKLSPFGYVEPLEITANGLSGTTIAGFAALTLILLGLSAWMLSRQDLEV